MPTGARTFSVLHTIQTFWVAHSAYYHLWAEGPFQEGYGLENQPRSESDNTRPPSAMVKNAWSYIFTHREHFSFTLLFTSPLAKHTIIYVASLLTRSDQYDPSRLWAYTDEQYFSTDVALVHLPVLLLGHRVILQSCLHALQTYPSITICNCVSPLTFRIPLATHSTLWVQKHIRWSSLNKDWIHRNSPNNNNNNYHNRLCYWLRSK